MNTDNPTSIFRTADELGRAEATLKAGVVNSNWQATGLALIVERLDAVLDRLDAVLDIVEKDASEVAA